MHGGRRRRWEAGVKFRKFSESMEENVLWPKFVDEFAAGGGQIGRKSGFPARGESHEPLAHAGPYAKLRIAEIATRRYTPTRNPGYIDPRGSMPRGRG